MDKMVLNRKKSSKSEKLSLILRNKIILRIFLLIPLIVALAGFGRLQAVLPKWPEGLKESTRRGNIMAKDRNGDITLFAEGDVENRRYPQGKLAANLIGFSGKRQEDGSYGLQGLEQTLDNTLQKGKDVTITIDPILQAVAQASLRKSAEDNLAENGAVVVIEAGTGRILAAASYPEYDANYYQHYLYSRPDPMLNRPFLQQVEPGSTFKPIVIAALLQSGRLRANELLEADMSMRVGWHTFQDVMKHDKIISVADVLKYSSNVGMIQVSARFSSQEFYNWLADFGFGQDVIIPHTYTRSGHINDWWDWVPQDHASVSIGQSLSVTALQLAAAYSVFANDGLYIPPYLVEGSRPKQLTQLLSPEVAATIRQMLVGAAEYGGARNSLVSGVSIAGKTGTADIYDYDAGEYIEGDYTTSFAGIFPADEPRAIVAIYLQKPRSKHRYGSAVAAPVFRAIASEAVAMWGMPPKSSYYASR